MVGMKIIINASNLRVGGAIQVALSVFNELHAFQQHDFYLFLSPAFNDLIGDKLLKHDNVKCFKVNYPSRFTLSGRVNELDILEKQLNVDCVFSIFGPNYWKPKAPHLVGFAQGYYLYSELPFFKMLNFTSRIKLLLLSKYHRFILRNHADNYVVETDDVKLRLEQYLNISQDRTFVATNTYSGYFVNPEIQTHLRRTKPFKLLTVAYPYQHKNLTVFKDVSDILNGKEITCVFHITVPDSYYETNFIGYESTIINLGSVKNEDCPNLYSYCDAMILPSLVECFSASYPESMKMKRPILTSDYSFAKSVCGDAALYFNALDPDDIANKVKTLLNDAQLYDKLVTSGTQRLDCFLSPRERCNKYINLLSNMVEKNV